MAEYSALLLELAENITNEDLDQLKSACKEDIPSEKSDEMTTCKDWFSFLEKHDKLAKGVMTFFRGLGIVYRRISGMGRPSTYSHMIGHVKKRGITFDGFVAVTIVTLIWPKILILPTANLQRFYSRHQEGRFDSTFYDSFYRPS